ncbi:MAG: orotidine-5'-phosphate decarboxylase [Saprospiraceae bacterium]
MCWVRPRPCHDSLALRNGSAAIYRFNQAIIDATRDLCVAYKPNTAFYEAMGTQGWEVLQATLAYIGDNHLKIADAKRGDIGNTSRMYARTFFETMKADAVTIAPYMGADSVQPFLGFEDKWAILLALTSNKGSSDFQLTPQEQDEPLYAKVMRQAQEWASADELMFVCGATHPEKFRELRRLAPEYFFLVPGIGAQGGDLEAVARFGMNDHCGLLVNSSRGIIYAGTQEDFAEKARSSAAALQLQMEKALATYLP